MKILLQSPLILDKNSSFHKKRKNVLIQGGKIQDIGDKSFQADKTIDAEGMILSPGWLDLGTVAGDPGTEYREDLESVTKAAAAGGFTEIALLPNTNPAIQTKNDLAYLTAKNGERLVNVHPIASVTRNNKGEELTDMIDLNVGGAVAFSDGLKSIYNTDIFLKSLQYLKKFDGVLVDYAHDHWLDLFGQMNEGPVSTALGLKGRPLLSEEVAVSRNLRLLGYAGGRLHLLHVSAPKAVDLVRAALKKGIRITCDVTSYQPLLEDGMLNDFDTNLKVNPPLRDRSSNDKLIRGLKDGTISIITSGHTPVDDESKVVEFDHAEPGMVNLQTVAAQLTKLSEDIKWEELLEKVTLNPRNLLGLESPKIEEGERANLTLLDPAAEWIFKPEDNFSKSGNSPFFGKPLKGKVKATFNNGKYWLNA
ncbi:MAG: dihydroorotase [Bacteroidetes bacterium]|nr:dihydroorotase [Bacteroidota bacterium]